MVCENSVGDYNCKCITGTVLIGDTCKGNHCFKCTHRVSRR